jgi:hypothetical protein
MPVDARLLVLGLSAALVATTGIVVVLRARQGPAERERRRRLEVARRGRMRDGVVTDVVQDTIYFSYSVMGVEYAASQDVSGLRERLPADLAAVIGPVMLKYLPANPANSIVACEEWCGLRARTTVTDLDSAKETNAR